MAPKGHVQATAGFEIGIPTGTVAKLTDAAQTLAKSGSMRSLTDEEIVQLFDAGVNLATSPPSASPHFAVAYSFVDRGELGIRYAGGGWRFGGRYQAVRHEDGPFDLVVGLGITRATTAFPVGDVISVVDIQDFTRWTFDVPVIIGTHGRWFRLWFGPKVLYSRFDTSLSVTLPMNPVAEASLEGHAWYLVAQGGVAVGYDHVFLGFELTLGELSGSATTTTMLSIPPHPTDISSFVVYPSIAVMTEF